VPKGSYYADYAVFRKFRSAGGGVLLGGSPARIACPYAGAACDRAGYDVTDQHDNQRNGWPLLDWCLGNH